MIKRDFPGIDGAFPQVSPDGRYVASGHHLSGQPARVYLTDLQTGDSRVLVNGGLRPVWSGNETIIYGGENGGVYRTYPYGTGTVLLDPLDYNDIVAGGGTWAAARQVAGHSIVRLPDGHIVENAGAPAMNQQGDYVWLGNFDSFHQAPILWDIYGIIATGPIRLPSCAISGTAWTAEHKRGKPRTWAKFASLKGIECQASSEPQFGAVAIDGPDSLWVLANTETRLLLYPARDGVTLPSSRPVMGYEIARGETLYPHGVFADGKFVIAHSLRDGTLVVHTLSLYDSPINLNTQPEPQPVPELTQRPTVTIVSYSDELIRIYEPSTDMIIGIELLPTGAAHERELHVSISTHGGYDRSGKPRILRFDP